MEREERKRDREMKETTSIPSPLPCPATVTVRRNPHRKARNTPYTTATAKAPDISASTKPHDVPSFPIDEILSIQVPKPQPKFPIAENLKVFLRIKPLKGCVRTVNSRPKNAWPKIPSNKSIAKENKNSTTKKKNENACVTVSDSHSVTLAPTEALQELKRSKTEVYEGFSYVFPDNSSQSEVYEKMVHPLVEDFLMGKSGMLAALGPSGSGKTHTVFGSPRQPGMVPLALRRIFKGRDKSSPGLSRSFYMSIFEIYSERGKGEKASDLLGDGRSDLCMQQSTIKGIQEVLINNITEADSLIAQAMLKRATATTNSNSQSSRSQCIINIRDARDGSSEETQLQFGDAVLTIVDLAGAEREKRTGNQGARLLESNFINNTSMVFGQCLRSLLEHQKNPKKAMQKHFQNSLLTRYLRDYLEGKKRMALILTVKAGIEDYLDTSFLLRQASPYMKIKFDNVEEICNKRQPQTFPSFEQSKKIKLTGLNTSRIVEASGADRNKLSKEAHPQMKTGVGNDSSSPKMEAVDCSKNSRNHMIMQNFAKAIWKVLKQYNEKLKFAESEIQSLKENLRNEHIKSLVMEKELAELKTSCACSKQHLAEASITEVEAALQAEEKFEVDTSLVDERNVDAHSPNVMTTECNAAPEGCNSSPLPSRDVKPQVAHSDIDVATSLMFLNVENSNQQNHQFCERPSVGGSDNKGPNDSNKLGIKDSPPGSDVKESAVISSHPSDIEGSNSFSSLELSRQPHQEDEDKQDQTLLLEKVEFTMGCNIRMPDVQTKPGVAQKSLDAEKPKRRLFAASFTSLVREINALDIEDETEKPKDEKDLVLLSKEVESTEGCNSRGRPDIETKTDTAKKPPDAEKPKRRLLPASSILLTREMNTSDIDDEAQKPKANIGGRKMGADAQQRTQGSITLLRLLKSNLHL